MRRRHRLEQWWGVREAAGHARVSIWTIYEAAADNELRHVRVGGKRTIRTRREWVDGWLRKFERGM